MPPIDQQANFEIPSDDDVRAELNFLNIQSDGSAFKSIVNSALSDDAESNDMLKSFAIDEIVRDDSGRITRQENYWGSQEFEYAPDTLRATKITLRGNDGGVQIYNWNAKTNMYESFAPNGEKVGEFKDIHVDQQTGEMAFVRPDGSGYMQAGNGDVLAFNRNGQTISELDRARGIETRYEYADSNPSSRPDRAVIRNLSTGAEFVRPNPPAPRRAIWGGFVGGNGN